MLAAIFLLYPTEIGEAFQTGAAWRRPECSIVEGTGAVTFTSDRGATLAPTAVKLTGIGYTAGLVALDTPNVLLATFNTTLLRSTNAGCSWTLIANLRLRAGNPLVRLTAAQGGRAYAWTPGGPDLIRIDTGELAYLKSPAGTITGLGTDPLDGSMVRLADDQGLVWRSKDGGSTWDSSLSVPAPVSGEILYETAFDSRNLDHALIGVTRAGVLFTTDGGRTWQRSGGFARGGVNVFTLLAAPSDGSRVWAMGLNLAESDSGQPSMGRHIYRSEDGGQNFVPVVDASPAVTLINGPIMAAPPDNPEVLYFVFGTHFQAYGTDLFRYDHLARSLTRTHNAYDDIWSIAFSPADPELLYLGLAVEQTMEP